jgi:hypothetical protein
MAGRAFEFRSNMPAIKAQARAALDAALSRIAEAAAEQAQANARKDTHFMAAHTVGLETESAGLTGEMETLTGRSGTQIYYAENIDALPPHTAAVASQAEYASRWEMEDGFITEAVQTVAGPTAEGILAAEWAKTVKG